MNEYEISKYIKGYFNTYSNPLNTSIGDDKKILNDFPSFFSKVYHPNFNISQVQSIQSELPHMSTIRNFMRSQNDNSFTDAFEKLREDLILRNIINDYSDTKSYNKARKAFMPMVGCEKDESEIPPIKDYLTVYLTTYPQNKIMVFDDLIIMGKDGAKVITEESYNDSDDGIYKNVYNRACYAYAVLDLMDVYIDFIEIIANRLSYDVFPISYFAKSKQSISRYRKEVAQMLGNLYPIIGDTTTFNFAIECLYNNLNNDLVETNSLDFKDELRKVKY